MTYALICLPFLALGAIVALIAARTLPALERRRRWIATGIAAVALLALTGVFDSIMIAAGLFGYAADTRLGPTIGLAPIEDFAYPIVAVLLVPAVWTLVRRRPVRRVDDEV